MNVVSRNYRDLIVWQRAMDLVETIYRLSAGLPAEERFGLTSQLRRSAVSIPSNIAEGQARGSAPDFVRFLQIAHGSLREAETQLMIAQRIGYLSHREVEPLLEQSGEVGRLLQGLIRSKKKSS